MGLIADTRVGACVEDYEEKGKDLSKKLGRFFYLKK